MEYRRQTDFAALALVAAGVVAAGAAGLVVDLAALRHHVD